jgi:hypothetical protein
MNQVDLRQWLLDSITQRFNSNADLSLKSDYDFSNSLFHMIVPEVVMPQEILYSGFRGTN